MSLVSPEQQLLISIAGRYPERTTELNARSSQVRDRLFLGSERIYYWGLRNDIPHRGGCVAVGFGRNPKARECGCGFVFHKAQVMCFLFELQPGSAIFTITSLKVVSQGEDGVIFETVGEPELLHTEVQ